MYIISDHARHRLHSARQAGITTSDLLAAVASLPGKILVATRFRGYLGQSGREFDIVVRDIARGRLIITVIGK